MDSQTFAKEAERILSNFVNAYKDYPERLGANSKAMEHFLAARALLSVSQGSRHDW
jgi:hypothetical protein